MSAIENTTGNNPTPKGRLKRKNTRVDLTPMVDLGFLLITFFVYTTQLSQPTTMHVNMPYDKAAPGDKICESCALTLLLQNDNTIQYYEGMPGSNPAVKSTTYAPDGIRRIILEKRKSVRQLRGKEDDFVLLIKPSAGSTFQNFVDIVDEVTINSVKHYYLDEITEADRNLISQK